MMTALVLVEHGVEALAATLKALVPAVPEGVVGDAVVLARKSCRDIEAVADAVGAALVIVPPGSDPWRAGAAIARGEWMFCLEDGDVPVEGWIAAIDRFIAASPPEGRCGRLRRSRRMPLKRLLNLSLSWPTRRLRSGDLVHRGLLVGEGKAVPRRRAVVGASVWRDAAFG